MKPCRLGRLACRYGLVAVLLPLAGCADGELETQYGQRRGMAAASVNGTGVFSEMVEAAGHAVFSWRHLSPRLQRDVDTIVWFPDDYAPPSGDVRRWLDDWLNDQPERTLVYVGRDFDAARWYWRKVAPSAPESQRAAIAERLKWADAIHEAGKEAASTDTKTSWFRLVQGVPVRRPRVLTGPRRWTTGIDPAGTEIELESRFVRPGKAQVLLASPDDVLVSRQRRGQGSLIVVTNGSFLLNLPLVNHEHRKLAGRLIEELGSEKKNVVFLESDVGGPEILDADPNVQPPLGLEVLGLWPASWILLHFIAVGIIFCFQRWPIFGRPAEPARAAPSDFGKHVDALGELLARSGDAAFAARRLEQYRRERRTN